MKKYLFAIGSALLFCSCATVKQEKVSPGADDYLQPVNDPIEGFNRGVQEFNGGVNEYVVYPVGTAYRHAMPDCIRLGISNCFGNLDYFKHAINCCIQGKFANAWDETKRFGVNTTVGVLGFRDVATEWGIPSHKEDFGQTFEYYGMGPGCYLNLPLLGPSTARDALGTVCDIPLNIFFWLTPDASLAISTTQGGLNAFETSPAVRQFFDTNYDTYMLTRAMYMMGHEAAAKDYMPGDIASNPDEALAVLTMTHSQYFLDDAYEHKVKLADAKRSLPYSCWLPKNRKDGEPNRIVVLLPGLSSHRLDNGTIAIAEWLVDNGYAVISISSTMLPEFFLAQSKPMIPGMLDADSVALEASIAAALADFNRRHKRFASDECSIIGLSLGGINALYLASRELSFKCNRIVAVNPPRYPMYALQMIDKFFDLPAGWGDDMGKAQVHDLFLRLAQAYQNGSIADMKMTREESQFLMGLALRMPLANMIDAKAKYEGIDILGGNMLPQEKCARPAPGDALAFSWQDYGTKVVLPIYQAEHPEIKSAEQLAEKLSVAAIADAVKANPKVRLIHAENDFLLKQGDLEAYRQMFGDRCIITERGSHLGFLASPEAKGVLLDILEK